MIRLSHIAIIILYIIKPVSGSNSALLAAQKKHEKVNIPNNHAYCVNDSHVFQSLERKKMNGTYVGVFEPMLIQQVIMWLC